MNRTIKHAEDLRWLIGHTGGFRAGYVTEVQILKRRLFDEGSTRHVPAGTTIAVTIHYEIRGLARVAKLTMTGVTDFSVFEQDGIDCSSLSVIQTELNAGKLRFWFDPQGELYVVCDEAHLEELTLPVVTAQQAAGLARWTFQGLEADGPTIQMFPVRFANGVEESYQVEPGDLEPVQLLPQDYAWLGLDVVNRQCENMFECSPLNCNGYYDTVPVNRCCLLDHYETADHSPGTGPPGNTIAMALLSVRRSPGRISSSKFSGSDSRLRES